MSFGMSIGNACVNTMTNSYKHIGLAFAGIVAMHYTTTKTGDRYHRWFMWKSNTEYGYLRPVQQM